MWERGKPGGRAGGAATIGAADFMEEGPPAARRGCTAGGGPLLPFPPARFPIPNPFSFQNPPPAHFPHPPHPDLALWSPF